MVVFLGVHPQSVTQNWKSVIDRRDVDIMMSFCTTFACLIVSIVVDSSTASIALTKFNLNVSDTGDGTGQWLVLSEELSLCVLPTSIVVQKVIDDVVEVKVFPHDHGAASWSCVGLPSKMRVFCAPTTGFNVLVIDLWFNATVHLAIAQKRVAYHAFAHCYCLETATGDFAVCLNADGRQILLANVTESFVDVAFITKGTDTQSGLLRPFHDLAYNIWGSGCVQTLYSLFCAPGTDGSGPSYAPLLTIHMGSGSDVPTVFLHPLGLTVSGRHGYATGYQLKQGTILFPPYGANPSLPLLTVVFNESEHVLSFETKLYPTGMDEYFYVIGYQFLNSCEMIRKFKTLVCAPHHPNLVMLAHHDEATDKIVVTLVPMIRDGAVFNELQHAGRALYGWKYTSNHFVVNNTAVFVPCASESALGVLVVDVFGIGQAHAEIHEKIDPMSAGIEGEGYPSTYAFCTRCVKLKNSMLCPPRRGTTKSFLVVDYNTSDSGNPISLNYIFAFNGTPSDRPLCTPENDFNVSTCVMDGELFLFAVAPITARFPSSPTHSPTASPTLSPTYSVPTTLTLPPTLATLASGGPTEPTNNLSGNFEGQSPTPSWRPPLTLDPKPSPTTTPTENAGKEWVLPALPVAIVFALMILSIVSGVLIWCYFYKNRGEHRASFAQPNIANVQITTPNPTFQQRKVLEPNLAAPDPTYWGIEDFTAEDDFEQPKPLATTAAPHHKLDRFGVLDETSQVAQPRQVSSDYYEEPNLPATPSQYDEFRPHHKLDHFGYVLDETSSDN